MCSGHARTKCGICGAPSLGEEFCAGCAHKVEVSRWTAQANLRLVDPRQQADELALREEKLHQAKFFFHQAVEVLFQGFLRALEAIHGTPAKDDPEPPAAAAEVRKAA